MRLITTAILAVVAVAFGIVIAIVDHEPDVGERAAALANVMLRFDPESIDTITVERGTEKVVIAKQGVGWFFSEPEQDRVDAGAVAVVLDQLNHLSIVDTISGGEEGMKPAQLGLKGDKAVKVTLEGAKGEKGKEEVEHTIILGSDTPRTNSIYARRPEDVESYVVDGNPKPYLGQPLLTMRDRKVIGAPVEAIVELVLRNSKGQVAMQRRVTPPLQDWAISEPLNTWADREKLDKLLAALGGLEIEEVITDDSGEAEIPKPLPEDAAVVQMMIYGFDQPLTLYLKKVEDGADGKPPLIEARMSDRPSVYRFQSNILEELPESAAEVRNRTLARIPIQYLDEIVIQSRIDPMVRLRAERMSEGIRWDVSINNKLVPANLAEVTALVDAVNSAEIINFTSDSAEDLVEYGLLPPARQVVFSIEYPGQPDAEGNPGPPNQVNRVLNLGWKEGDEQRLYANFEGEESVYELDPSFVGFIPTHPIKWRSLSVLTFNQFHLRSITREIPGRETLTLEYDYRRNSWKASQNGVDITERLEQAGASRLQERLGSLTADGWFLSLAAQAYEALQSPSARFTIVTSELDPAVGEARPKTYHINFAPSSGNIYFGQIDGTPDVFYVDHEKYRDLIRPITTGR